MARLDTPRFRLAHVTALGRFQLRERRSYGQQFEVAGQWLERDGNRGRPLVVSQPLRGQLATGGQTRRGAALQVKTLVALDHVASVMEAGQPIPASVF